MTDLASSFLNDDHGDTVHTLGLSMDPSNNDRESLFPLGSGLHNASVIDMPSSTHTHNINSSASILTGQGLYIPIFSTKEIGTYVSQ